MVCKSMAGCHPLQAKNYIKVLHIGAHPIGAEGGAAGLQLPNKSNLKKNMFADMMISNFLYDLPFNHNQPLKLTDDYYIRTLKRKMKD